MRESPSSNVSDFFNESCGFRKDETNIIIETNTYGHRRHIDMIVHQYNMLKTWQCTPS